MRVNLGQRVELMKLFLKFFDWCFGLKLSTIQLLRKTSKTDVYDLKGISLLISTRRSIVLPVNSPSLGTWGTMGDITHRCCLVYIAFTGLLLRSLVWYVFLLSFAFTLAIILLE